VKETTTGHDECFRLLVVEDCEDDCALLLLELTKAGRQSHHQRVESEAQMRDALERQQWDMILADYSLPGFSGLEALAMVRDRGLDVPFLFVSGTMGEDTAVAAMRAGAQDYIMKDALKRLAPAVERELRETRRRRLQQRAEADKRKADARFLNVLNTAVDAVIVADEQQHILVFNQGAETIFGYSASEMCGKPLDVLLLSSLVHVSPGRSHQEVRAARKGGMEFPGEISVSRMEEAGSVTFTIILRDISERKRGEQEMHLLQTLSQAASETKDVNAALAVTLRKVCEATGWVYGQAWLPLEDENRLACSSAWYALAPGFETFRGASEACTFAPGQDLPGKAWMSRQAQWMENVSLLMGLPRLSFASDDGLMAGMAVPVLEHHQVIVVLEFFMAQTRHEDAHLMRVVSGVAAQLGGVIQRKRAEERFYHLAHHDSLTGLPNRLLCHERLEHALSAARRHGQMVGVAFLDLDRFKTINDSLGHDAGDQLLVGIARRLSACVRETDTIARLSGDEFAIILENLRSPMDAVRMMRKITRTMVEPFEIGESLLHTSVSIGVTLYPSDGESVAQLLRNADIAMYRAKQSGGKGYRFYLPEMTATAHARLAVEGGLHEALEQGQLRLHYQPVLDLNSGSVSGHEVLVRWQHPERGLLLPSEFIAVAEESELIVLLGEWVLRSACEAFQRRVTAGAKPLRMAVNVSPRQFQHSDLVRVVLDILRETGFDPGLLDLEITENVLMDTTVNAIPMMRELNTKGISFSVDDFGTGYSSLAYLKSLPIRSIKIDRSFVGGIPADRNDVALVKTMISMAHDLGTHVVAEGVETHEQLELLRQQKCDFAQGFYIDRPMAEDNWHRGGLTWK